MMIDNNLYPQSSQKKNTCFFQKHIYFLFFIGIYLALILIIKPYGNFPLNDDWAYAWSVKKLTNEGVLRISDWSSPSLVFQVIWGALFVKLFGFSFFILRVSVITLSLFGIYSFFLLINKIIHNLKIAFGAACILLFNPIYFNLTFTFMTDVPFVALMLISFLFYYKFTEENNYIYLFIGSIFSALSFLIRQLGLFIPIGVVLYLFISHKYSLKAIVLTTLPPLLTFLIYLFWFNFIHHSNWANTVYVVKGTLENIRSTKFFITKFFGYLNGTMLYAGLSASPFLISFLLSYVNNWGKNKKNPSQTTIISTLLFSASLALFLLLRGRAPYFPSIFSNFGLGAITVSDPWLKSNLFFDTRLFWQLLTLLGFVSIIFLFFLIVENKKHNHALLIIVIPTILLFLISTFTKKFFDRYTIPIYPVIILYSTLPSKKASLSKLNLCLLFLLFFLISTLGTCDYFRWNEAKWDLGQKAFQYGIKPSELWNGFDWMGFYTYEKNMGILKKEKTLPKISEWEWINLNHPKACISFSKKIDNMLLIDKMSYKTPFSKQEQYIYLFYHTSVPLFFNCL